MRIVYCVFFFFSSRRRHTRFDCDWSSDVCSSDLTQLGPLLEPLMVLVDVYRALYKARGHRGALDFDAAEAEFVIDAGERVRAIELRVRNDAHRLDRKSTRLNSSHSQISYAVFCLK